MTQADLTQTEKVYIVMLFDQKVDPDVIGALKGVIPLKSNYIEAVAKQFRKGQPGEGVETKTEYDSFGRAWIVQGLNPKEGRRCVIEDLLDSGWEVRTLSQSTDRLEARKNEEDTWKEYRLVEASAP